jgi:hypothetical protein
MILFLLLVAHVLCDYPLQGDFLARGKNHKSPLPGVPWYQCLLAHALIQGGAVVIVTGIPLLGIAEVFLHAGIDYGKCAGRYGFNTDQLLHLGCKLVYVAVLALFGQYLISSWFWLPL